jgi:hypothetical protein
MTTTTKILLAVSLSGLALGFTNILWGFGMPVGAVCFGLFMISKLLEKETALLNEQQQLRLAEVMQPSEPVRRAPAKSPGMSMINAIAQSR